MPADLVAVQEGLLSPAELLDRTRAVLLETPPTVMQQALLDPSQRDIAAFDLKIVETGLTHSGVTPPERLTALVDTFSQATGRPPIITYEELIFVNPLDTDPRTFTTGEVGRAERDFYEGHHRIEGTMEVVNTGMRNAIAALAERGPEAVEEVRESLGELTAQFKATYEPMHALGRVMDPKVFNAFRIYFLPLRGLSGASGAFSASIPEFDYLLGGETLEPEHVQHLEGNKPYFPSEGYRKMEDARVLSEQGLSLNSLQQKIGDTTLTEQLAVIDGALKRFRGMHMAAVAVQLPDVFVGNSAGSTGEPTVPAFLRRRKDTKHITEA